MRIAERTMGTGLLAFALLVLSGCVLPPVGGHALRALRRDRATGSASTYQTTHCVEGAGILSCSSKARSIPQVGACGDQTPVVAALNSMHGCQVRLNVWTALPTGRLLRHADACVEPLLNFRLADDTSMGIGTGAKVARILEQARHPALGGGWESMDSSACNVVSP